MVSVSQDWVIDSSSGWLADKQPAHGCAAGTALCSDSVMNYWPFNTHSRDGVSGGKKERDGMRGEEAMLKLQREREDSREQCKKQKKKKKD